MIEVKNTLSGKLNASIVKEYPQLEEITITPTLEEQELKPEAYGYSKITINAIPAKDIIITPTTESQKQEGIFKTITVNAIEGEELNLNPSEEQQNFEGVYLGVNINPIQVEEITTDLDFGSSDAIELSVQEGSYIKKATINKPTNLIPENIKSGETVCGISGINADTSDADATSDDIILGKSAYVANEKIQGTFKPLDTSDATATAEDIAKDKTAYVNGEKVIGAMEVSEHNATIDLSNFTSGNANLCITKIENLDMSTITNADYMFNGWTNLTSISLKNTNNIKDIHWTFKDCKALVTAPEMDLSNTTDIQNVFNGCSNLQNVPVYNLPKATIIYRVFYKCTALSDESLNNILMTCIKATSKQGTKSLAEMGLTEAQATVCQGLSNYQAFLDAGWVTGY